MRFIICTLAIITYLTSPTPAAETHVNERGVFFIDNQPRIPLAAWMQPAYLFQFNNLMGIECIFHPKFDNRDGNLNYKTDNLFDLLNQYNLTAIDQYRDQLRDKPAVWGWMNNYINPNHPDRIENAYNWIRTRDTSHAVFNNISIFSFLDPTNADGYRQSLKHTDAIICHVWPEQDGLGKRDIRNVVTFIKRIRELCKDRPGGEVSIWIDINPHEWSVKDKYDGHYNPAPTRNEFRFQFWASLIHGADAICLFPISFDPFVFNQIPAKLMQEVAWNAALLKRTEKILTSEESTLDIKITGDSPTAIVDYTTRQLNNEHYIFLTNGEDRQHKITLALSSLSTKWQLHDVINNKPITTDTNTHNETLHGLDLRIWKLSEAK